ncbi:MULTISPECIES: patatin-like phospholipase family protein [unclassified Yoonia]|uniref:patatin-like phospholipase family protein n=1 Tax=unclassified Yoonia TaxID=2629118 RepID=UPI002AFF3704|nr:MULTISPECIES: patatin-like phospholipase family protein [unclassified Yoonia]
MKRINLALQGGGAHGAFTWGVLDVLLADEEIEIAAISATSAGALNAAALKSGWVRDGRAGARENLDWLWGQVAGVTHDWLADWVSSLAPSAGVLAKAMKYSPGFAMMDMTTRMMSPYVYGPMFRNPLEDIVSRFQYDAVCAKGGPELHICATNVRSGKIRVFTGDEISSDVIMASACLPTLFQAVEFTDPRTGKSEAFWDGGYSGNPALFPLFRKTLPDDILVVNINPLYRAELPTDVQAIQNRINEISFNSSLLRELRAIAFVKRLLTDGAMKRGTMKDVIVHLIADDVLMNELNVATKTIPQAIVIARLKEAGQAAATAFLAAHKSDLNVKSTVDLEAMFK